MATPRRPHRTPAFASALPLQLAPVRNAPPIQPRVLFRAARARRAIRMQMHSSELDNGGRAPDYYTNVGAVIDTLRIEYPHILLREPDLSVFAENMIFSDRTGYRVAGKDAYRTILWMVRAHINFIFASSSVQIQSLYHCDDEGAIYLRWRVQATPRMLWLMGNASYRPERALCIFDGMSVYKLNVKGLIAEHMLDNNIQNRSRLRPVFEDILAVGKVRVKGTPIGAGAGSSTPQWYKTFYDAATFVSHPDDADSLDDDAVACASVADMQVSYEKVWSDISQFVTVHTFEKHE